MISPNNRRTRRELVHKRKDLVADLLRQAKAGKAATDAKDAAARVAHQPAEIDRHR